MATQSERREKTRAALLAAARRLFLERGYAETSTAMILETAGVSKGALYHHFAAKEDMLAAIFEEASRSAIEKARKAVDTTVSPLERLRVSARAWLDQIRQPETAKILLELGPQGLGWRRAKAIEDANSLVALSAALVEARKAGEIDPPSIEIAARLLNALLAEAALLHLAKGDAAKAAVDDAIDRFVDGYRSRW